jgi:DNA-binding NtrC family response regulator
MKTDLNIMPQSVWILDDDQYFLQLVNKLLNNYFKETSSKLFTNKEKFMVAMRKLNVPQMIILDYNLGVSKSKHDTAHEVLNQLEEIAKNIPVILISGEKNEGLLEEYQKYRNIDYIVKNDQFAKNFYISLNKLQNFNS